MSVDRHFATMLVALQRFHGVEAVSPPPLRRCNRSTDRAHSMKTANRNFKAVQCTICLIGSSPRIDHPASFRFKRECAQSAGQECARVYSDPMWTKFDLFGDSVAVDNDLFQTVTVFEEGFAYPPEVAASLFIQRPSRMNAGMHEGIVADHLHVGAGG